MMESNRTEWCESLDCYKKILAITFASNHEQNKAVRLFWSKESKLYNVPRDIVDRMTLVLPAEVVPMLEEAEIKFTTKNAISMGDLTVAERRELRAIKS